MWSNRVSHCIQRRPCAFGEVRLNVARRDSEWHTRYATARDCRQQEPDQVRQLAAGVAHNFNNLLTTLMCGSEWALDRLADDHPARTAMELVSQASDQAANLVRQLMAYAGISPLEASPVDLSQVAAGAAAWLSGSISRPVKLRLDLAASLPVVQGDSGGIEQLIHALLANAVEAIGDGTGIVSIRTRAGKMEGLMAGDYPDAERSDSGDYVCLEVSDTGCGMEERIIRQIFDPFFSTKAVGRGLGLAAAAGTVRAHRGAIRVESTLASGSTFRVYFPVCTDEPAEQVRAA